MQELFFESTTDELILEVTDGGLLVAPSNVDVEVYDESGALTASADDVTVSDDKRIRYAPGAATTAALGLYFRALWKVTVDGIVRDMVTIFSVVKNKLVTDTNDEDLLQECPALDDSNAVFYGETESGATTTSVIDSRLKGLPDNEWKGGTIRFLTGTYADFEREIAGSVKKTGVISWITPLAEATVPPADPAEAPTTGDEFLLKRTFKDQVVRAWSEIVETIYSMGNRPALILNPEVLKTPCIYKALEKVCRSISNENTDVWWGRSEHYMQAFERAFKNVKFLYDDSEDQIPSSFRVNNFRFGR